jgi:NTE family protein
MRRGLVLGCGGTVGSAWQVGVLAAVQRVWQWDPRSAAVVIGTSGGAMLSAGVVLAHVPDQLARQGARR